jgi:hypothetical protein
MEASVHVNEDLLNLYGFTPLWDTYYESSQNKKFKNKWDKVKDGWRPRKRNVD